MPTALITGATAGIGAAFARRLASDGFDLVLLARDEKRLDIAAAELSDRYGVAVETLTADLATDEGMAAAERRLAETADGRGVDLLINNAGFGHQGTFLNIPVEDEVRMLRVHCDAVLRLTYAALPGMIERGRGGVVNVASVAAFFTRGTYGASKAWAVAFSQGVTADLANRAPRVKVMALCPGFTRTEFHERAQMDVSKIPDVLWLDADDVVDAALRDLRRGVPVSVPGSQWKAIVGAGRMVPLSLARVAGKFAAKTGRKYDEPAR